MLTHVARDMAGVSVVAATGRIADDEIEVLKARLEQQNQMLLDIVTEKDDLIRKLNEANSSMDNYAMLDAEQSIMRTSSKSLELEKTRILLQQAITEANEWKEKCNQEMQKNSLNYSINNRLLHTQRNINYNTINITENSTSRGVEREGDRDRDFPYVETPKETIGCFDTIGIWIYWIVDKIKKSFV